MAIINSKLMSMTYEEDYVNANGGTPVSTTWYPVSDYSGSGIISSISIYAPTTQTGEYRISTDGGSTHSVAQSILETVRAGTGATDFYTINVYIEFQTAFTFDIRRDGDTNAIHAWVNYAHLSDEFKREIIPAGQPIPNKNAIDGQSLEYYPSLDESMYRPTTYDKDIMLVWFTGENGISNKIEWLPEEKVVVGYESDGTPNGILKRPSYNLDLKKPRISWAKSTKNTSKIISLLDGKDYEVSIKSGTLDSTKLPKMNREIIDAKN